MSWLKNWWDDFQYSDLGTLVLFGGGCITFLFILGIGIANLAAAPEVAKFESLRADMAKLGCQASEDVVGQAVMANRDLASNKVWNDRWYTDLFVPDKLAELDPIPVPECK